MMAIAFSLNSSTKAPLFGSVYQMKLFLDENRTSLAKPYHESLASEVLCQSHAITYAQNRIS